jgi:hypothetical protein
MPSIAKNNLSRYSAVQHSLQAPQPYLDLSQSVKEARMNYKALIASIFLVSSLFVGEALAKPDLTPEQLARARETAQQMKPPVDFDALLQEADRLGIECEGDLTRRAIIKMCKLDVETSQSKERQIQSKERQAKLDAENAKLDEEYKVAEERLKRKVNDLADQADKILKK